MELQTVAKQIELKIQTLEKGRGLLKKVAQGKAVFMAIYEKDLAKTIIALKNGQSFNLSGQTIVNPLATVTEKIARGICWKAKLKMEKAEANYKIALEKLKCVQAELSGYQSIFRFFDEN